MDERYYSFLLRLWSTEYKKEPTWFASLQASTNKEPLFFHNFHHLMEFLEELTKSDSNQKNWSSEKGELDD